MVSRCQRVYGRISISSPTISASSGLCRRGTVRPPDSSLLEDQQLRMTDLRAVVAIALVTAAHAAAAQSAYPNRTIQMIVPLAAASAVDNAARIRRAAHVAEHGTGDRHREPARRGGPDRRRSRGQGCARRLHHRRLQRQHHDHAAESARDHAVGHPQGLRADIAGGHGRVGTGGEQRRTLQDRGRSDRRGQGESRQDQLRLGRQRQPAARRDGSVRDDGRHFTDACAVQGRDAGGARRCVGTGDGRVPGSRRRSRRWFAAASCDCSR